MQTNFLKMVLLIIQMDLIKEFKIDDPKNKIILIYNHGQDTHDAASKAELFLEKWCKKYGFFSRRKG